MSVIHTEDVHTISTIAISKTQTDIEKTPSGPVLPPKANGSYKVDRRVVEAFPMPGTKIIDAFNYGGSLWGKSQRLWFICLRVVSRGKTGRHMCEGEYESLKAIYAVSPSLVPKTYSWGELEDATETYFLITAFRDVCKQPADPLKLAAGLADMHQRSISPTGKFGFHFSTCHAKIAQAIDTWVESWCTLYGRHLEYVIELVKPILKWPEFDVVCDLTLKKVVPRLLLPLQADGRTLKPCLLHGNCWDGNIAVDAKTGEAFVFDTCSFYGHNEYDTGNWRAPRHRLKPMEDWDARNLLYSLTFNIGNTIYIPGSQQRQVVYDDMKTLCQLFCPDDLKAEMTKLSRSTVSTDAENNGWMTDQDYDDTVAGASESEEEEEELPL
ncbi:Fructosamin-kin multi-domain protein [Pyrenophora tritici-repentis]|nr:Fructosamin-kin multi-domain protein [Pyrenophora tritici-repentis]KAI1681481.1 Fructosamin-kin multi-domain protein [Pyrenophora tritici-repentis]